MIDLPDFISNPLMMPSMALLIITCIFMVLFYIFKLKPRLQYPLQNERVISDNVTFWLPRGYGVLSGPMVTARMTMEGFWSRLIQNEKDDGRRKAWEKNRDFVMKHYLFAIKDDSGKKILLFDENPEDQKFLSIDPQGAGMILHGVEDCKSVGKYDGFEYLAIKLNADVKEYSDKEAKEVEVALGNLMFLRDAAKNIEKISHLQEAFDDKDRAHKKTLEKLRETSSKLDRALSAAGIKPLTQREEAKLKGGVTEKVKQLFWSTPWQLATALAGFLLAPYLVVWFGIRLEPPINMQIFSGFMAAVGFFVIPIGKKIFARWL